MPMWLLLGCGVYDLVVRVSEEPDDDPTNTDEPVDTDTDDPPVADTPRQRCLEGTEAFCTCVFFLLEPEQHCTPAIEDAFVDDCLNGVRDGEAIDCFADYAETIAKEAEKSINVAPPSCIFAIADCVPTDTGTP